MSTAKVSSNSSPKPLADFIGESLVTLQRECPLAYHRLCTILAPRELLLIVDNEQVALTFQRTGARIIPQTERPAVTVWLTHQTILDLVDARLSLNDAVMSGAMDMKGTLENLVTFYDGFLLYLKGAVRCPSFPPLLDRYRYRSVVMQG